MVPGSSMREASSAWASGSTFATGVTSATGTTGVSGRIVSDGAPATTTTKRAKMKA